MKVIELKSLALLDKFQSHNSLKENLLSLIENSKSEKLYIDDGIENDNIQNLDWSYHNDFNRPWIKLLLPSLKDHFQKCVNILHYESFQLNAVWFQQYYKNGIHNWHSHGDNYTGVYYLEMNKENPRTELIEPATDKKITLDCKEGDIIIFPAFMIHRAPINTSDKRKTIVSFNFNFLNVDNDYGKKLS